MGRETPSTAAVNRIWGQVDWDRLPKVQLTMAVSCCSLAMYCIPALSAEKK